VYIITRDGRTTVITGWRAWLMFGALCVVGALVMVGAAFLLLGLTVTIATILLFVVPLAIAAALVSQLLRALKSR